MIFHGGYEKSMITRIYSFSEQNIYQCRTVEQYFIFACKKLTTQECR